MVAHRVEGRIRVKRELTKQAISLATEGRWEEAAEKNRQIVATFPRDTEACNRLGKALSEIGQYSEARESFKKALAISPNNPIARKNLQRMEHLQDDSPQRSRHDRVPPTFFIEETGKTGITELQDHASSQVLASMSAGEQVELMEEKNRIVAKTTDGQYLGAIEPKLAIRLTALMRGGNKYAAATARVGEAGIGLFIRETYQHPSQKGKLSFPLRGRDEFRPYMWEGIRYDADDEDEGAAVNASGSWSDEGGEAVETVRPNRRRSNFVLAADGDEHDDL